jgi:hypothetical protein
MPENPVAVGGKRTARAKNYEKKTASLLNMFMKAAAGNPATIADAAALISYGPTISAKLGDLADEDPRVRRAVDFVTSGTENPYASLVLASIPLLAQVVRNHETETPVRVGLKIPFTKGRTIKVPFSLKLRNPFLRNNFTYPSQDLTQAVFGNPAVRAAMIEQRITVAFDGYPLGFMEDDEE